MVWRIMAPRLACAGDPVPVGGNSLGGEPAKIFLLGLGRSHGPLGPGSTLGLHGSWRGRRPHAMRELESAYHVGKLDGGVQPDLSRVSRIG